MKTSRGGSILPGERNANMKIITKRVGEAAKITEIEKLELEGMQKLVGGLIQPVYIDDMICWVDEEGKLKGKEINIAMTDSYMGEIIGTLEGDVFFTNETEGEEGLSSSQIQSLLERLNNGLRTFARSDLHLVPILVI